MEVPPLKCGCCWKGMSCCETHTTVVTGIYSPLLISSSSCESSPLPISSATEATTARSKVQHLAVLPWGEGPPGECLPSPLHPKSSLSHRWHAETFPQTGWTFTNSLLWVSAQFCILQALFASIVVSGYRTGSPNPLVPQPLLRTCFLIFRCVGGLVCPLM